MKGSRGTKEVERGKLRLVEGRQVRGGHANNAGANFPNFPNFLKFHFARESRTATGPAVLGWNPGSVLGSSCHDSYTGFTFYFIFLVFPFAIARLLLSAD